MGMELLPQELVFTLREQWPCRELQLRQLSALLSVSRTTSSAAELSLTHSQPRLPTPSTIVVYGPCATGKSSIVRSSLGACDIRHVIVQCKECITGRHLLERTIAAVHESLQQDAVNGEREAYKGRCENLSALAAHLQRMLRGQGKYILVFDGIDKQREVQPTLLPALARLGEFVRITHRYQSIMQLIIDRYPI